MPCQRHWSFVFFSPQEYCCCWIDPYQIPTACFNTTKSRSQGLCIKSFMAVCLWNCYKIVMAFQFDLLARNKLTALPLKKLKDWTKSYFADTWNAFCKWFCSVIKTDWYNERMFYIMFYINIIHTTAGPQPSLRGLGQILSPVGSTGLATWSAMLNRELGAENFRLQLFPFSFFFCAWIR